MKFPQSVATVLLAALVMKEISQLTFVESLGLLLLAVLLFALARISYSIFKIVSQFPTEARSKNLKTRYSDLIIDLTNAVEKTSSVDELTKSLENIDYPPETLLVVMQKKDCTTIDRKSLFGSAIINRFDLSNQSERVSEVTWNGHGHGHYNDQHFFIMRHPLKKFGYDYVEINLARTLPELTFAH